jgi:hypothetical protein
MESHNIVRGNGDWAISHNRSHNRGKPEGSYPTKEGALEVVYLAASSDIKRGAGIAITVEPPSSGETAIGAKS